LLLVYYEIQTKQAGISERNVAFMKFKAGGTYRSS